MNNNKHKNQKAESTMIRSHPSGKADQQNRNNSDPGNSKGLNDRIQKELNSPERNQIKGGLDFIAKQGFKRSTKPGREKIRQSEDKLEQKQGKGKKKPSRKKKKKKKTQTAFQYIKKSSCNQRKQEDQYQKKTQKFKKLEQQMRNTIFEEDHSAKNGNGKPRSRSLSSGRSSNKSSRSVDGIYGKARSQIPKSRQNIIDEREDYLLNKKKFYNLKFEKKLEMIKNSPKKIAREFYKIDYIYKFLSAISRNFKSEKEKLKLYRVPLKFNKKGEVELTNSYYVLLNSIDFFHICRNCKINSFDATKDTKKGVSHKISLMIKKMKVNEESLGKDGYEENLKYNRTGMGMNFVERHRQGFNPLHVFRRR